MRSVISRVLAIFVSILILTPRAHADEVIRDYYAEPGINPFSETLNQNFSEHIDPFSGTLRLSYVDLLVPGNGGLEIKLHRTYTSLQESLGWRTVTGVGWSMHFGRIIVSPTDADKVCNQQMWSVTVADNPSLEHPDGSRELLVLASDPNAYLITKSRWKADCLPSGYGLLVTAPDGTEYVMDQYEYSDQNYVSWYTSEIRDTNGNTIDIAYKQANGYTYIDTVTASDGRFVQFSYANENTTDVILSSITANGQTWQYNYTDVPNVIGGHKHLTEVVRPDGTRWGYEYHPQFTGVGEAGSWSLSRVTYPHGGAGGYGTIEYSYAPVYFEPGAGLPTTVLASKTTSGPGITPGAWQFDYSPAMANPTGLDVTTISAPDATRVYYHFGYSNTYSGSMWMVGLLLAEELYGTSGNLLQQTYNDWSYQSLSSENYWHGRDTLRVDPETVAPLLLDRTIWRDSAIYETAYENYDAYGNPGRIVETGNIQGDLTKITEVTYYTDPSRWIINLPKDETIVGIGTLSRTYDAAGNLLSQNKYGVATTYTYTAQGDIATITDARGNVTEYLDYHRGIPRQENHPEGVTVHRSVNDTGTVASETNGRGYTRTFSYDGLNRLTAIQYPVNDPVTITWSSEGKRLTRGAYQEDVDVDGFGRPVRTERRDTLRGTAVTTTETHDAVGRKVFASYPNSSFGTTYAYDELGRTTRVQHVDGAYRTFAYLTANEVRVRNERGFETTMLYRAYGDPDEKDLLLVQSPENIETYIDRNQLGQPVYIWQGDAGGLGYARTYEYDTRYFLTATDEPEIGRTELGRDAVGNLVSRQVATSGITTYQYDGLNRLVLTDYPGSTPDVQHTYDSNGNLLSLQNASATRTLAYDANDNLTGETVVIDGRSHDLQYTYDGLDFLTAIIYPSGRTVSYAPDALGRPTQAAPYATAVAYHPSGQPHQITYANGQTTEITLNDRLWVDRIRAVGGATVVDLAYGYDELGNVTAIGDLVESAYSRVLGYDGVDRLTGAQGIWGAGSVAYDTRGNITAKTLGGVSNAYTYSSNRLYSTDTGGGVTYVDYDVYGNQSATIATVLGQLVLTREYLYDDAHNLREARNYLSGVTHQYGYDGENRRVLKTVGGVTTDFIYGRGNNVLGEYTAGTEKEYIYLGASLLANVQDDGAGETVTYYHLDALGSPVAASDAQGGLLWREAYEPHGERLRHEDGGSERLWYTAKPEESEFGLSYFGARWYDANLGRFLGMDPVAFQEDNVHSFNRYAYANNNPYAYIDPDCEAGVLIHAFQRGVTRDQAVAVGSMGNVALKAGALAAATQAATLHPLTRAGTLALRISGKANTDAARAVPKGVTKSSGRMPDKPDVIAVDSKGNAIPLKQGEYLTGSKDGRWIQVRDANGNPTGMRIDGPHSPKTHNVSRALEPHAHRPGVTNEDGMPWLPINR